MNWGKYSHLLEPLPKKRELPSLQEVNDVLSLKSLRHFIEQAWRQVETRPFVPGWHIDAICDHLEAVSRGQIRKLIINMPPRHMKSLGVSVFWSAWEWLHSPQTQWLFSSYAESLSVRDSVKCRRLIQSPYYQRLLGEFQPDMVLVGDQNTKIRFENNFGGYRLATSVDGSNTGEGGDRLVVDDAHNVREVESPTQRLSTLEWWDLVMSTRLNDQKTGAIVIIMQRSHENDLVGHILDREKDWETLILPARYEGENRCQTSLKFVDPRTEMGEPLFPARFGDKELKDLESHLGEYGSASQLQQRPAPRHGGMFKIERVKLIRAFDRNMIADSVRYWDKAATEAGGCNSAGVLIHRLKKDQADALGYEYLVEDVVAGQWSTDTREARIKQTAELDKEMAESFVAHTQVKIWIEQEPGSGGKDSAFNTIKNLSGFPVSADRVTGDKVTRAEPFAAQVNIGRVACLIGDWTDQFLGELELFPMGRMKDRVDAGSGAFNKLNERTMKAAGVWGSTSNATIYRMRGAR